VHVPGRGVALAARLARRAADGHGPLRRLGRLHPRLPHAAHAGPTPEQ
jgi:hypothetical protein